ncbi:SIMPL domain-containing protein [Pseudoruegeria sp. HB172150]|uniref:SIMPL domain-containing protein n=1 Tax=Pseudoruegeria sp. HB172150 TaxID=2721164 RepID=UPI00155769AF|nr:SIMPL domain-containing protein [Pseudoruegeria sp. HB172150]
MRILPLLAALLLALPAVAQQADPGRLTVTGEGSVASAPDMALITLGVTSRAETAAAAMDATSDATAAVLETLTGAGIAATDMQTSDLTLFPLQSDRSASGAESRITGYEAGNTLTIRVRDLDTLGTTLDAALDAGANTFRGLSFALQDPVPALDEARRRAVADARRKAELYAEAAGITLGPVLELSESGGNGPQPLARFAAAEAMPIAAGEVDTSAAVTLVFQIATP